jgi:Cu(I)/Ag(I) efflux system membrane fusion protein
MFKLVNQDTVWIDGYLFEEDKNLVSIGDKININISGTEEYETIIDYIYPELDEETLSLKFRATIENKIKSKNLKPNMIADITIKTNKKIRGLFIPKESLIQTEHNNRVIVKKGNNFIVKEVVVGYKNNKYAQILKGLAFKEKVVTSSQFLIDSEASLSGAIIRIGDKDE